MTKRSRDIASLFQKHVENKAAATSNPSLVETVAEEHLEEHTREFHVLKEV
jgi:hypothetical protein